MCFYKQLDSIIIAALYEFLFEMNIIGTNLNIFLTNQKISSIIYMSMVEFIDKGGACDTRDESEAAGT